MTTKTDTIWTKITAERERQQRLFPGQTCLEMAAQGRHEECLAILMEEVGEVARALNEHRYSGAPLTEACTELVQVAAVALAWREGAGGGKVTQAQWDTALSRNVQWPDQVAQLREERSSFPTRDLTRALARVGKFIDRFGGVPDRVGVADALLTVALTAADWHGWLGGQPCIHNARYREWPTHCGVMQEYAGVNSD